MEYNKKGKVPATGERNFFTGICTAEIWNLPL